MSVRTRISLDGVWQFQHDPAAQHDISAITSWRSAQVPMPWQAQFADLRHSSGVGWYRHRITLDAKPDEQQTAAILHFGAVDYHATVWVNGQRVGEHEGGYLPFEFDVTTLLQAGENELVVRVADPTDDQERWPTFTFSEIPHGKQSWYGPLSGIWQSVWLELRPTVHLRTVRLTPDPASGTIDVTLAPNTGLPADWAVRYHVAGPDGATVSAAATVSDTAASPAHRLTLATPPAWWSPDQPALYTVTAALYAGDTLIDELSATCGFRTVEAKAGRIYLNGEPIYLRGALDQAYYPETIYTPPSLAYLEDQVHKAKALGLNCLRCHIKIEDPRYYEVADRLGILIWTEIPNWIHLSAGASQRAKETFVRMVARDWNHPSIIAWTLVNENWGTDLARNPEHRIWLAAFYHEAKQIDPHRLIVDNSACEGNLHVAGDLDDFHHYRAIPDHATEWDDWVADFAGRADWAWAQDFAHERRADLPLIVSEFGNWGLPHPDAIREGGQDPWWFENGLEWGDGIVYPHGMRERFTYWGLDKVFGDLHAFTQAHQQHMARSLAYEITTMRLDPRVAGYVITEFTDVHWECNGLMDMKRNLKAGLAEHFTPLNQDRVVVARPRRWSGRPGESIPIDLRAFGVDGAETQGTLHWQTAHDRGDIAASGGTVAIPLTQPGIVTVQLTWVAPNGETLAHHLVELAAVAPAVPNGRVRVIDNEELAAVLVALGYVLTTDADAPLIATRYTMALQEAVQQGAALLLIAGPERDERADRAALPTGHVVARAGTGWQGDWATSFSWLRKEGPFAALPGDPLLAMEYAAIMPDAIIGGVPARAFPDTVWAGLALGWIHKPVSLLHKAPYGGGEIVVTTFKLNVATLRDNVVAQALLAGCIALLGE
jgi:hypothetical protein